MRRQFELREEHLDRVVPLRDLGEILVRWCKRNRGDREFVRLVLREALQDSSGRSLAHEESRRAYYQRQVAQLRGLLAVDGEGGPVAADLEMSFLALLAVTFLPSSLPQVVRLVTGLEHDSPAFVRRWNRFLRGMAGGLASAE